MILAKSKIMVFISLVLNEYFYRVTRYSCFICGFDLYASLSHALPPVAYIGCYRVYINS